MEFGVQAKLRRIAAAAVVKYTRFTANRILVYSYTPHVSVESSAFIINFGGF